MLNDLHTLDDDATDFLEAILDLGAIGDDWSAARVLGALATLAAKYAHACELTPEQHEEIARVAWKDESRRRALEDKFLSGVNVRDDGERALA